MRKLTKPCEVCGLAIEWPGTRSAVQFAKIRAHRQCQWELRPRRDRRSYVTGNVSIDANGCWLWQAAIDEDGYGRAYDLKKRRAIGAHRLSWTVFQGLIPPGMHVLHKCDVRACVNPLHLFLGDNIDNNHDMTAKGRRRAPKGEAQGTAKLTEAMVRDLRSRDYSKWGSMTAAARELGLDVQTVRRAIIRETWKHVEPSGSAG